MKRWENSVEKQIKKITSLTEDDECHVKEDILNYVHDLLYVILHDNNLPPKITPMSNGSVLIEWHFSKKELEIEVIEPGEVYINFENESKETEKTLQTGWSNFSFYEITVLKEYIRDLHS